MFVQIYAQRLFELLVERHEEAIPAAAAGKTNEKSSSLSEKNAMLFAMFLVTLCHAFHVKFYGNETMKACARC